MKTAPTERPTGDPRAGFTLIELVLAVGLLGGAFIGLLFLRTSAVDQAWTFNTQRAVQRVAQEKLDEVVFGIEENRAGSIDDRVGWEWEIEVYSLATSDTLYPLLECQLTLRYPRDVEEEPEEYLLTTRFFADETHPLAEFAETDPNDPLGGSTGGF